MYIKLEQIILRNKIIFQWNAHSHAYECIPVTELFIETVTEPSWPVVCKV